MLFTKQYIEIQCDKNDFETYRKALDIPYLHVNRTKTKFRTSIKNIDLVLKLFKGIDEYSTHLLPDNIRKLYDKEILRRIHLKTLLELGPSREPAEIHGGRLEKHQQLGLEIAEEFDRFAFFYSTRTGKTIMSLKIIEEDIKRAGGSWLVLCPLILIENAWLDDASKYFPNLNIVVLHDKDKRKRIAQFAKKADLYIGNIESFVAYKEFYDRLDIKGCFIDESSTLKSHQAKVSKSMIDFSLTLDRWYLLSGTPAPNCEAEYYMQLRTVDLFSVHSSRTQFVHHFFNNTSYNPQYEKLVLKPERRDEFMAILQKYSLYVDKEDVMETPGKEFIEVSLSMPDKLQETYDKLKKELFVELSGNDVTASTSAAAINKLNQITSGFIIDSFAKQENKFNEEQLPELYELSEYRYDELEKILETIGDKQVVIWAYYRKEFEIIKKRLGDKCALIYGATTLEEKNKALKAFKAGNIQYLVANPASADKGITLVNSHHCIYFSIGYSLELFIQSQERIYGGIRSQPNKCYYYIMMAKGTVDELIYKAVQQKFDISFELLNYLRGDWYGK